MPPVFSLNDRIGLIHDVFALAGAGYTELSVALDLVHHFGKGEEECKCVYVFVCQAIRAKTRLVLAWQAMRDSLDNLVSLWWEDDIVHDLFQKFQKVSWKL